MAKEGFNWKSLFINDSSESEPEKQEQKLPTENFSSSANSNKFPETSTSPPLDAAYAAGNPFLEEVIKVYEKGFEGLNSDGFDFFEGNYIQVGGRSSLCYFFFYFRE